MKSKAGILCKGKQLIICRHAKSSWQDALLSDFERPLNKRGERDAPVMGRRLAERGIRPDLIMTSKAARALATASYYAVQLGYPMEQLLGTPEQYAATVPQLIRMVQGVDPKVTTLMLVGHNPESTGLANALGDLTIDNIPTCGIVALAFSLNSWLEVAPGLGTLLFFDSPKMIG
jgi:phosphohistidine phosphatase